MYDPNSKATPGTVGVIKTTETITAKEKSIASCGPGSNTKRNRVKEISLYIGERQQAVNSIVYDDTLFRSTESSLSR